MSDGAWVVLASVRFGETGYDVVQSRGRFFTRLVVPGGVTNGPHDEVATLQLLADIRRLANAD